MLHYKTFGEGNDGPPLVILHGLFGMLDNWQTLARRWAEQHTLVLADLRNHGRSPHEPDMNYDLMATDVAELLEELGHDRCYLLGHSMGGKVAMRTALKFPGLVEKLIVVDIAPRAYAPGHATIFAALEALDPSTVADRKEAAAQMANYVNDPGIQLFLLKNLARDPAGGYRWRMNLPVIAANYDELISGVAGPGERFPHPALFLRGGNSGYVKDDDLPLIKTHFPTAELVTVADAGHWVHAERPTELMAAVDAFLAG
ncbi:alpha/beta fold hydrolase [Neolewinella agarilytica]|uniref:Pimeloyl-ACP methyl ester carboxylesterase n=1 Tax=Neolewinella agarilytica TaxID=478744 RepID=A0A1H9GBK4_9BACT|nr:alpha/beta fold hydrolase [Neolewinella agarilytica]SEQ47565.1 Pimeloyl-ACP methyl ester carboxylesterase [Neolewinella agarilytica]